MAIHNILLLIFLTLVPAFELRASIPIGIAMGVPWQEVFLICVAVNILLGPLVYFLLDKFLLFFCRFAWIDRLYNAIVRRTRKRAEPYAKKYGLLGIALFVAIPLPGSGSYTGALAAYLLGIGYKKFAIANLVGVLIAGALVTAASLGVLSLF